jgi:hypothetical protein
MSESKTRAAMIQLFDSIDSLRNATDAVEETIGEKYKQIQVLFREYVKINKLLAGRWSINLRRYREDGYTLEDAELCGWSYQYGGADGDEAGNRLYNEICKNDWQLGTVIPYEYPDKLVYLNFRDGAIDVSFHKMSCDDVINFMDEFGITIREESLDKWIANLENRILDVKALKGELPLDTWGQLRTSPEDPTKFQYVPPEFLAPYGFNIDELDDIELPPSLKTQVRFKKKK